MALKESAKDKAPEKPSAAGTGALPIVGIGASAGGLKEFEALVRHIPAKSGIAWVLIQHMAPDRESHLEGILARHTALPVTQVTADTPVAPDHIYVIAPGCVMTVQDGRLRSVTDRDPLARRTSIDAFLLSLAAERAEHCGCALLSGAGSDGTIGLKAVKEAGGLTLTQTLGTAEYDSMLLSAVRTGLVDREMAVEDMPAAFAEFLVMRRPSRDEEPIGDAERQEICRALNRATGHDFSGYKTSTVDRRIRRRMQMLGVDTMPEYIERLRDNAEATRLFRDLLIGVTQFFRDTDSFAALASTVLPRILEGKTADDEIRVWVAGCATGEEAYSIAMMLQDQVSAMDSMPTLRVFGTDIDENALHFARLGRYPKGIVADVSPERLKRYFDLEDGTFCVRGPLREICLFAQHDMLKDPPFSRIDLISCRNVLIYMNNDLQSRLMPVFHYALRRDGFLFLGPAENTAQNAKRFAEIDRRHRIFRRIGEAARLPEFPLGARDGKERTRGPAAAERAAAAPAEGLSPATRRILEKYAPTYVVIDGEHNIVDASAGTSAYLELPAGRPRINLSAMARSGLAIDVKAAVATVMATGKSETRTDIFTGSGPARRRVALSVEPLPPDGGTERHYLVVFQEMPAADLDPAVRPARDRDEEVTRALEYELLTTKERLQTTLEELETSNEELRASNEELSSVNEELQSSNEELETSKEELQSLNEELRTVNNELSARVDELSEANSDLKNLFDNTQVAMLFLDPEFRIKSFTPPAKPLFRLRDHDLGRPLDELSGRLDYVALKEEVRAVISGGRTVEHEVTANGSDEPQTFIMRILPYRDEQERIAGAVLTFIDITERKKDERRLSAMVSELNHRVRNALAGVQAMVQMTQSRAATVDEFAETVRGRLQAMGAAHNLLSETEWEHADLQQLVRNVVLPFATPEASRVEISGPSAELRPGAAVSMGMILHELATNAAKYGAWSTQEGAVAVRWRHVRDDGGSLELDWEERGGPPVVEPEKPGFGIRYIRQSTGYDLHGKCSPEFRTEGFRCRFVLPATLLNPTQA